MLTPMMGNRLPDGVTWAADSGCFKTPEKFDPLTYIGWLAKYQHAADRCLFATAPDVVGDAKATLKRLQPWPRVLRALGYRAALVAQDGLETLPVPWEEFDVLFIGGTTAWKLSDAATGLVREARARGKWTHHGRVNSLRRLQFARWQGCDSADGTYIAFGPDINAPRMARWVRRMQAQDVVTQQSLWEAA